MSDYSEMMAQVQALPRTRAEIPLDEPRTCGKCGTVHRCIPVGAVVLDIGDPLDCYSWECGCHSTLSVPITARGRQP